MVTSSSTVLEALPEDVVGRAITGDEVAFARIVALHHRDMLRVCFVICGREDRAEEAAQVAWQVAWRRLGTLRDQSRLRSWLVAVAANEARQLIRREARRTVVEIQVAGDAARGPDPAARVADLDLARALGRIAPEDRALLALRYVVGLDSTELARELQMSPSGVRSRLARLAERLRMELSDE